MEIATAVQTIAEHCRLDASQLQVLLDAVTRTERGRKGWIDLARVSNSGHCGKVSINFDRGNMTDSPVITTTVGSLVKVGDQLR